MAIQINKASTTPVYRQIYAQFRQRILDRKMLPGARLPSINQLQRDLGVARESIKRAMADLAADDFIRRIQGKGTFVSMPEAGQRFWGIVIPFYAEFYNKVIVELRHVAEQQGIVIEHACDYDSWSRQMEIVNDFSWRRAEAIIIVPTRDEPKALPFLQKLSRHDLIVIFDHSSIASQLPYVIQDYVLGVRKALTYLAERGARKTVYVRDPLWVIENPIYQTMEETYSQFCAETAENYNRILDSPHALTKKELAAPEFDSVVCVNDQVACLMTGLLREAGISVPEQVQVIGYNKSDVGQFFTPPITTTTANLPKMCDQVQQIIQRYKQGDRVELLQYVALPEIVEGGTTRGKV